MREPNESADRPPGLSLGLHDIYHVLFRHKGKILAIWIAGAVTALVAWAAWPVKYQSAAQLYIHYVVDNKSLTPRGSESELRTIDQGGQGIINTEVEILNSYDLALQVAQAVGPETILERPASARDINDAASVIQQNLIVSPARASAVIHIFFQHPNPDVVRPVLTQLISSYLDKHADIHLGIGSLDEQLIQKTTTLKNALNRTEQDLQRKKLDANVTDLEATKKMYAEQIAKLQDNLLTAEADLAEHRSALNELLATISPQTAAAGSNATAITESVPREKTIEYRQIVVVLENLQKQEQMFLLQGLEPSTPRIQAVQAKIVEYEGKKTNLEELYPQLIDSQVATTVTGEKPTFTRADIAKEQGRIKGLESRIANVTTNLSIVRAQFAALNQAEAEILELERRKAIQEENYRHFSASLEQARFDESSKSPNISEIQKPTPPFRDTSQIRKKVGMIFLGFLAGGLALAFFVELFLDRSFKRPSEVEARLGVPLFLSIPDSEPRRKHALPDRLRPLLTFGGNGGGNGLPAPEPGDVALVPKPAASLYPYFEALRDRLITFFELRNMTHNPKLVAVTSCGKDSGTTTVASGLAATLSETGEGNVLLVDMNIEHGAAHFFHKGKLACGLDDALENDKRSNALVQSNLYVVAETPENDRLPRILQKRFSTLLPKLRGSDYDYIIFDLPPVSQISSTSKLARFMDMVFLVVEAEKTDRDLVKRATQMLTENKANVGVVLNKSRTYVPRQLQQEL